MRSMKLLLIGLFFAPFLAQADGDGSSFSLLKFRGDAIYVSQGTGNSYSGELSWNPAYRLSETMSIVGDLGVTDLMGASGKTFIAPKYQLLLQYDFKPIFVAAGAGAQTWMTSASTTALMVSGQLGYKFDQMPLGFVEHVFVNYSALLQTTTANEIRAGIGMSF